MSEIVQPSIQDINLVLQQAASAPLQNLQHASAVSAALQKVEAHFKALNEPKDPAP